MTRVQILFTRSLLNLFNKIKRGFPDYNKLCDLINIFSNKYLYFSTLTMDMLLESLIAKAKLECEEAHRQLLFSYNGLFLASWL